MKPVTRYQTLDGREFSTEQTAHSHESEVLAIRQAVKPLGPEPIDAKSGRGWIQHNPTVVASVKIALLRLMLPMLESFPELVKIIKEAPETISPYSVVGRILDDSDSPIRTGWYRIMCIDPQGREHEQPYFAMNGPRSDHVCLEDRR